jgi:extracellular factor (EF) 3-hydroxypalmitic acid methyl ester biosynthesis protein
MASASTYSKPVEQRHRIPASAKTRLEYLTPNDWALVADQSRQISFAKDEVIIHAGRQPRHVLVILGGKARIESSPGVKLAQVGEGDICGEMSFLEGTIASASVIADTDVEVLAIEWTKLQQLFDLYPHLGSRFYRSLALNLSRRLRRQLSFAKQ